MRLESFNAELDKVTDSTVRTHIEKFLRDNFTPNTDGLLQTFQLKGFNTDTFSEAQIKKVIQFLNAQHYTGQMRMNPEKPILKETTGQMLSRTFRQNFPFTAPAAFLFQMVNALETTALLSAIWEKLPDFDPTKIENVWAPAAITLMLLASLRSTHLLGSVVSDLPHSKVAATKQEVHERIIQLGKDLGAPIVENDLLPVSTTVMRFDDRNSMSSEPPLEDAATEDRGALSTEQAKALLCALTRPSTAWRSEQEFRAWMALATKECAAFAVFFEELKGEDMSLVVVAAIILGLVQGIDSAFSGVIAVGGHEHQSLLEANHNILPALRAEDRGYLFTKLADFSPVVYLMARNGAAAWALITTRACLTFFNELFKIESTDVSGGLYGIYAIIALSSAFRSSAFSLYTVSQKLGLELPTIRDFGATESNYIKSLAAMSLPAIAAYITHIATGSMKISAAVAAPLWLTNAALITAFPKYAAAHHHLMELRFIPQFLIKVDGLHIADQLLLTAIGTGLEIHGRLKNNYATTTVGEALLFLMVTAMLARVHRPLAAQLRYATSQMFLFAAAMTTWILNFFLSMKNIAAGRAIADHPTFVDPAYFGEGGRKAMASVTALISYAAGAKDNTANGAEKVPDMSRNLTLEEKQASSYFVGAVKKLTSCCMWKSAVIDNDETMPIHVVTSARSINADNGSNSATSSKIMNTPRRTVADLENTGGIPLLALS